jgi:DNA processing protein
MAGMLRRILGTEQALLEISKSISAKALNDLLPKDIFRAPQFISTLEDSLECWRRRLRTVRVEQSIEKIDSLSGSIITPESHLWPRGLSDLGDSAPAVIWCLGDFGVFENTRTVSIVGARIASTYGLSVTRDLVAAAVSKNYVVVSGGALGIDATAHASAIEARGKTIALMAGGLDRLYPARNSELFEAIKLQGLLISELPPGSAPARWRFLQRNRLIAAIGQATVVVEAGFRSGSINTAGHANELDRPVGAVPGPINSTRSEGCHQLIKDRRAELISTPSDLFDLLALSSEYGNAIDFGLTGDQTRVLDSCGQFGESVESIALKAGMTINQTKVTIEELKRSMLMSQTSNGWIKTSNTL